MTATDILALAPGPSLDNAVNTFIFGGSNPNDKFSTDDAAAAKILDRLSLFVGRVDAGPRFSPGRPWLAGILAWENSVNGHVTRLSVASPTRQCALCKAALLVIFQPAKSDRVAPRATSEQAAKEVAARIGTPGARNPVAGIRAAEAAAAKKQADRAAKEEKDARKAARRAGVAYSAPVAAPAPKAKRGRPAATAPIIQPRVVAPVRTRPQPAVFTGERAPRAPMPKRVKEFVPPQAIDTGGNDKSTT